MRRKATLRIENSNLSVRSLPKLTYIGNGTNIMQKARVFSTMMYLKEISEKLSVFYYIKNVLINNSKPLHNGAVFKIKPLTGKYDVYKYTLFVSVKTSDVLAAEQNIIIKKQMKKVKLKCEVVFINKYKPFQYGQYGDEIALLCTDHGSIKQRYQVENIKLLRYFADLNASPNFLRELIYSDVRKIFVDIDFSVKMKSAVVAKRVINKSGFRERDTLCKHETTLINILSSATIFLPGIIDEIIDMLILSIDYNVWDKQFYALSKNITDLYISADDILSIFPDQLKNCENLKQITINANDTPADAAKILGLVGNTIFFEKNIWYTCKSLQYIDPGLNDNTIYLKKSVSNDYVPLKKVNEENLYLQDGYQEKIISNGL